MVAQVAFMKSVLEQAPWSVSKADSLMICMRSFALRYIEKQKEVRKSEDSRVGVAVHEILEHALENPALDLDALRDQAAIKHTLMTTELAEVNTRIPAVADFVTRIQAFKARHGIQRNREFFEYKVAIDANFAKCGFFDDVELAPGLRAKGGLMRGVIDHAMITPGNVMIIIDHKTGRKHPIEKHEAQFNAYRLMAMAAFPEIVGVQCAINYVGEPKLVWAPRHDGSDGAWTRAEVERLLRPWLTNYLNAMGRKLHVIQKGPAPAEVGWKCEWCGYTHLCEPGNEMYQQRMAKKRKKQGEGATGDSNV